MRGVARIALIIFLLLSVLTVFVSPNVDLEPTALRAMQFANLLFAVLVLAGSTIAALLPTPFVRIASLTELDISAVAGPDLLDLNCARLC